MDYSSFYNINHNTTMSTFNNETLPKIKSSLFYELALNEETTISNTSTIQNLFHKHILHPIIQSSNKTDSILTHIISLSKQTLTYHNIPFPINNNKNNNDSIIHTICQRISYRNYKMNFTFTSEFVYELSLIISYSFIKLNNLNRRCKFTYETLCKHLYELYEKNVEVLSQYKQTSFIQNDYYKIGNALLIPYEMVLLMNIFQHIKKLTMCLEETSQMHLHGVVIILLNTAWLFPHVIEVELDLTCERVVNEVLKEYEKYIESKLRVNQRKLSDDSNGSSDSNGGNTNGNNNSNSEMNMCVYINDVNKNKDVFYLIIVYVFYISKFTYLSNLTLISPNSFNKETELTLTLTNNNTSEISNSSPLSFHYIDCLLNITNLCSLSITFNPLESTSFSKIHSLLHNNLSLETLSLNFFTYNDIYYTSPSLFKLSTATPSSLPNTNIDLMISQTLETENIINSHKYTLNISLLNTLLPLFETNIEKLFILLHHKKHISSLSICFDIPYVISQNEQYFMSITKFIFNILTLLNQNKSPYKQIQLIAPFISFNSNIYPFIDTFFDNLNLYHKNNMLRSLYFKVNLTGVTSIVNVISVHLVNLYLGELDIELFKTFVLFYQSEEFVKESQLESVGVNIKKHLSDYTHSKEVKAVVEMFFHGKNPKYVKEVTFESGFNVELKDVEGMLRFTNGNNVVKYTLKVKQKCMKEFLRFDYEGYYYFNKEERKEIRKYMDIARKIKGDKKRYCIGRIMVFLVKCEKKEIVLMQ